MLLNKLPAAAYDIFVIRCVRVREIQERFVQFWNGNWIFELYRNFGNGHLEGPKKHFSMCNIVR